MKQQEHWAAIDAGDLTPHVVEHATPRHPYSSTHYVAWTPTWEGPARPEYIAALADLNDKLRG